MKKLVKIIIALALVVFISALLTTKILAEDTQSNFESIDTYVEKLMEEYKVPGVAIAVIDDGKILYTKGYGKADDSGRLISPQTPFIIGSTSKSITALAMLQLVEDEKINLDAPVQTYLPWFSLGDGKITVRQILNQTSGISTHAGEGTESFWQGQPDAMEKQVKLIGMHPLAYEPGSKFEYSNANYQIAGLIIQNVSGLSYREYVQKYIFTPLDMNHTYMDKTEAQKDGMAAGYQYWFGVPVMTKNQPYPEHQLASGFIISSVEDMAHFLIPHASKGEYQGVPILSENGILTLHEPVLGNYAMGWGGDYGVYSHNGSVPDYGAQILIDTRREQGVVVLFNISNGVGTAPLYSMASNILRLTNHLELEPNASNSLYYVFMICLPVLLIIEALWFILGSKKFKKWHDNVKNSPGLKKIGLLAFLPLMGELGVGYALWSVLNSAGIRTAFLYQPDFSIVIFIIELMIFIWIVARVTIFFLIKKKFQANS